MYYFVCNYQTKSTSKAKQWKAEQSRAEQSRATQRNAKPRKQHKTNPPKKQTINMFVLYIDETLAQGSQLGMCIWRARVV